MDAKHGAVRTEGAVLNDTVPRQWKWYGLFIDGDCLNASSQSPSIAIDAGGPLGLLDLRVTGQLETNWIYDDAEERKHDATMYRQSVTAWRHRIVKAVNHTTATPCFCENVDTIKRVV